ncbi:MAG TPA: phospholipase D-like domain-containing protein, partial [Solirubrobacterales bacterium]|nr:phospholipase D-like domain-containing protein [Solirubrobacterales bacterium]
LMDKVAVGRKESVEKQAAEIQEIRNRPNVVVAIGNRIPTNSFDRWLRELDKLSPKTMVPWVHTKFMLVDPLSKSPTTITGSANWSDDSTSTNNENMVIVHGDQRVADVYLGEFMRLHAHYAFRESLTWRDDGDPAPQYLEPDKAWQDDHFDPANDRCRRRLYFARSSG